MMINTSVARLLEQAGCPRPAVEGGWRGVSKERLGCWLFGENQFSLTGDAQPVFLPGVLD